MIIPKIDKTPMKHGAIVYPHVSPWDIIKEYAKLTKPYWWLVFLVLFGVTLATITGSVISGVIYKKFFDTLTIVSESGLNDIGPLVPIVYAILVVNFFNWIGWRLAWYCAPYLEGQVMADGLQKGFDYTLEHSHNFFISNFAGSLGQKIIRFARSYEVIFDNIFFDLYSLFIKVIGALIILYFTRAELAGLIAIWVIAFLAVSFTLSRLKHKYDVEAANQHTRLVGAISDSISNHASVQSYSGYSEEGSRVSLINTSLKHLNIFRWWFGSTLDAAQALLVILTEFCVFYFGIQYWQQGLITLGTFVLVQSYMISIGGSLWNFSRVVRNLYQGMADAKELVEILHLRHEITDVHDAKKLRVHDGKIEFKNVNFKFGKESALGKRVFDGLSLTINPGEKIALIGPSGAGKSTLVKLLLRLHDIEEGEIIIDGQNIKEVTQESLRNNISLVPQDPALFHRTLMENIRYGRRDATDEEVIRAAKLAHCDDFINELPHKYDTYVGERGVKLSGGERQRVAIARAILKNAPILILDEATSSLDSHSETLIQDALHTLMKGKTTIIIAHRLSTIRSVDRIIVVNKGGIVEEGSHEELLDKEGGIYAKLWRLQAGGFKDKSIEELLEV